LKKIIQRILIADSIRPDDRMIFVSLAAALVLSAVIWGAYRLSNTRDTYQPRFAATLVSLVLISTILMDLIQSNLALSLGCYIAGKELDQDAPCGPWDETELQPLETMLCNDSTRMEILRVQEALADDRKNLKEEKFEGMEDAEKAEDAQIDAEEDPEEAESEEDAD
jgi:hypothetical protein